VKITQKELGDFIGMSRESTNKQLRAWHEVGWVHLEKGMVVVTNAAALARSARN
jgi:CRP/FNR family cyclic AMP-dependent transcriptional regulator